MTYDDRPWLKNYDEWVEPEIEIPDKTYADFIEDSFSDFADRAKDMLIVGGYKVFSREVEETLYGHPAVKFCAIVGLPNPDRPDSDIVKALIQLDEAHQDKDHGALEKDIAEFCTENMAPYKRPKQIAFVDKLPLTAVGKVDKKALRN